MKKMFLAGLLMVAVSTALFSREFVARGKTHTSMGDYKIELADNPVMINNEQYKTFVISYDNSPLEVKVVVLDEKKCKNYIVLSDNLNVKYVCNKKYFGVEKLDNSIKSFATSDDALNRSEYFHQKVISSGEKSEMESTQLIAAFFPMLLKEEVLAAM